MSIIYQSKDRLANGRYEVIKVVGEGGAGIVYLARDNKLNKDVAIKVLRPEMVKEQKQIAVFQYEAHLALQLHHPNIIATYETGSDLAHGRMTYHLVMEYLPGGTLVDRVKSGVTIAEASKWMEQLLQAMSYAHRLGVIHQDVKSANVYLTNRGEAKIGDFGLARLTHTNQLKDNSASAVLSESAHQKKGTPAYMSPELCYGELQDERSDIYSLGVLFFELLTGRMPFEGGGMIELARQHVSKPVPCLSDIKPAVPLVYDRIVKKMMAKDKEARYQSVDQILHQLANA